MYIATIIGCSTPHSECQGSINCGSKSTLLWRMFFFCSDLRLTAPCQQRLRSNIEVGCRGEPLCFIVSIFFSCNRRHVMVFPLSRLFLPGRVLPQASSAFAFLDCPANRVGTLWSIPNRALAQVSAQRRSPLDF